MAAEPPRPSSTRHAVPPAPAATAAPPRATGAAGPSAAARELIRNLPEGMLHATAARFPHVIEAIARDWATPARMHATLDAFVFDARGDRRGFPPEVVFELAELRARYERWVGPRTATLG